MKIAFLNIFNGLVERGSEIFISELATQLCRKHQVQVFQLGKITNKSYKEIQITGVPIIRYQSRKQIPVLTLIHEQLYHLSVLLFTLKCVPHLLREKPDWVIPINGRLQVIIIQLLRFLTHFKILITGHAGVGFEDRFNIVLGRPDVFVALTPIAFDWAKKISPSTKTIYIPNGINLSDFSSTSEAAPINLSKPIVLCVSALLPYKRIELLIEAVSRLKEGSLLLIGDGEKRDELELLGKTKLGSRFLLIPYIPHKEIARYYKAAHVFSLPSKVSEAFGLVYLEALACNISVVSPDDENRRAILGDAGLYCNVEDPVVYANTLQKALMIKFGDKPRKQAEKFSWEKISVQYSKLFSTP